MTASIRPIEFRDDAAMATIIRRVMPEFGAEGEGYAIVDPEVDGLTASYRAPRSTYLVATQGGLVVGGAGIAPLSGADPSVCELRKMYLLPAARGRGLGRALLAECLNAAVGFGFHTCYLETIASMTDAHRLYLRAGFVRGNARMGDTGHHACNIYYVRDLSSLRAAPLGK